MAQTTIEQERSDLLDKKLNREYDKMRMDMEHDLSKRYHWKERAEAQDKQWERQKNHWVATVIIACFAIVASATAVIFK